MGVVDVGEVGFDTALNFALGLPKHDLGWPPQRPLFRDNIISRVGPDLNCFCRMPDIRPDYPARIAAYAG